MNSSSSAAPQPAPFTTVEDVLSLSVEGFGSVGLQITGTWAGTISFECSIDGVTYTALLMAPSGSATQASSTTAGGIWTANVGGLRIVRARLSTDTSGTSYVSLVGCGAGGIR